MFWVFFSYIVVCLLMLKATTFQEDTTMGQKLFFFAFAPFLWTAVLFLTPNLTFTYKDKVYYERKNGKRIR